MDFKIINPTSRLFGDAILSADRQHEISKQLDDMCAGWDGPVRTCHLFHDIAAFCNTPEELVYATVLHLNWHYKRGITLA